MKQVPTRASLARGVDRTVPGALAGSGRSRLVKRSDRFRVQQGEVRRTTQATTKGVDRTVPEALAGSGRYVDTKKVAHLEQR